MMLNTKKRPLIAAALLLTSFGITTSCIDNSYDLNRDIDMTISAGGEHLAIPVGYTEKITLDKIIELDEGDDLQIVDGEYHLLKKDNIDETNTSVKLVTVNESSNPIEPIRIISGNHDSDVYDILISNAESEGFINAEAHGVDKAVIEIGSLAADMPTTLTLKLKLSGEISTSLVKVGTMTITFPNFIQFEKFCRSITERFAVYTANCNVSECVTVCHQIGLPIETSRKKPLKVNHFQGL